MTVVEVFTFVIVFLAVVRGQRSAGDICTLQSTGSPGECKLITNCPEALQLIQQQQFPQTCGFDGTQPIVCCAQSTTPPTTSGRTPGEVSKQKCREYSKYVFERKRPPILLIDVDERETNECGHKVVELIVGGELAKRKEFPHMAVIGFDTPSGVQWLCGGTIISEQHILTAGHCLNHREFGLSKYVQIGMTKLTDAGHRQAFDIIEHIKHPKYTTTHYNDIALVKLDRKAKLNPYARPACLYTESEIRAHKAIASGFGKTDYAGSSSDDLLKVTLDFVDNQRCNSSYKNQISRKLKNGVIDSIQVCAGSNTEAKDTCQGDSGGPLQIYHIGDDISCMYDIVGVTSFGKACSGSPGVYTRVSSYIKWIEDTVWP